MRRLVGIVGFHQDKTVESLFGVRKPPIERENRCHGAQREIAHVRIREADRFGVIARLRLALVEKSPVKLRALVEGVQHNQVFTVDEVKSDLRAGRWCWRYPCHFHPFLP